MKPARRGAWLLCMAVFIYSGSVMAGSETDSNTFYGRLAGSSNSTGTYNSFFGELAGEKNTGGKYNTFLGAWAGREGTLSDYSTAVGYRAGRYNTGDYTTLLGAYAGYLHTNGTGSTFIGYAAGYSTTTEDFNTFVGNSSGYSNTGNFNTFLGYQSGYTSGAADLNTYIGYQAGFSNTTGGTNSFIGGKAGYSNTDGGANVFLGSYTGYFNTSGAQNTFIGAGSGYSNVTGSQNTFIGFYAGNGSTGSDNTSVGRYAGNAATGAYNTFVGGSAGAGSASGASNTFVGYYSGGSNGAGNNNVSLGYQAGRNNNGSNNIFLGFEAGNSNYGSGNIFIGHQAGYSATGSNKLYLDNSNTSTPLVYGDFSSDILAINGSLGIGTTSPATKLDVNGTVTATGMDINGNIEATAATLSGTLSANAVTATGAVTAGSFSGDGSSLTGVVKSESDPKVGTLSASYIPRWSNTSRLVDSTIYEYEGNVGIGTAAVTSAKLTVAGTIKPLSGIIFIDGTTMNTASGAGSTSANNTFYGMFTGTGGDYNTFLGKSAGNKTVSGSYNTFVGTLAGMLHESGSSNTYLGYYAGASNTNGTNNTFIGRSAGENHTSGSGNVFLGYQAGNNASGSNKLYIENSSAADPLIYGEFDNDIVKVNGKLGVGAAPGTSQLTVGGVIESTTGGIKFPDGSTMTTATNATVLDADTLDGKDSTEFAASAHTHSGSDIDSGTVAEARIDAAIARDSEIMTTVLANDGSGSTIDADSLDGFDSSSFMSSATDNWVNTSGDIMTGDLVVEQSVEIDLDLYVHGNIYAESDVRSKHEIRPIESSLRKINNIKGIKFKWKREEDNADRGHYGVIAQQVEKVLPEIVTTGTDGRKKVAYMGLIPILIEAMKEQQNIISGQQKIMAELQEQNMEIIKKMSELEMKLKPNERMAMAETD